MVDSSSSRTVSAVQPGYYTVAEIAERWKLSTSVVRRIFRDEEGVLKIGQERPHLVRRNRKKMSVQRHVVMRIPEPVLRRVEDRLMHKRGPEAVPIRDRVRGAGGLDALDAS